VFERQKGFDARVMLAEKVGEMVTIAQGSEPSGDERIAALNEKGLEATTLLNVLGIYITTIALETMTGEKTLHPPVFLSLTAVVELSILADYIDKGLPLENLPVK
jgi:hypothetical protein